MLDGREARHVDADLRDQDSRGRLADSGDRHQECFGIPKGLEFATELSLQFVDAGLDPVDLCQVHPDQEAMVGGHDPRQGVDELLLGVLAARVPELCKGGGIRLSGDDRVEDLPAGHARQVRQDARDLDIRILQHLVNPLDVATQLSRHLFTRAG